ncbi:MAG: plasmid pRiA4b ORF-3 family protein, partial [Acidobacteria bacterium]|nr:plasmid pRiA4b ORF-3 family protein [Acidobacteriota bacterium]
DPANKEHDSMLEWLGGSFDPEAFDPERINAVLRAM